MPHDPKMNAALKYMGFQLVKHLIDQLLKQNVTDTWEARDRATTLAGNAIGFVPIAEAVDKRSDEEILAAVSRAEAILDIIALCEGHKRSFVKRDPFL
jgi:hypothetical protein